MNNLIKTYVNELQIANKTRGNCPVCYKNNTFSITNDGLYTLYYCFSVNCGVKGRVQNDLTLDIIIRSSGKSSIINIIPTFEFVRPNILCDKYLSRFGINGTGIIRDLGLSYDPKQHRLVFPLTDFDNKDCGYVGRALDSIIWPKWFVYLRLHSCPFILGKTDFRQVLLVEDCISAIRAAPFISTIGLLGTNIPAETIPYITRYDEIFIALDDDALLKSIKLQKQLSFYKKTKIIPIRKDIKNMTNEELKELECLIKQ